jgi:hypothetical protein
MSHINPQGREWVLLLFCCILVGLGSAFGLYQDPEVIAAQYAEPAPVAAVVDTIADVPADSVDDAPERPTITGPELLCLTQIVYSEASQDTSLQRRVAWVTRLRKETAYREKDTYCQILRDPWQYSAFRPDWDLSDAELHWKYTLLNRSLAFEETEWQRAQAIAERIATAPLENNIWTKEIQRKGLDVDPMTVRHFAEHRVDNAWTREAVRVWADDHFVYYAGA